MPPQSKCRRTDRFYCRTKLDEKDLLQTTFPDTIYPLAAGPRSRLLVLFLFSFFICCGLGYPILNRIDWRMAVFLEQLDGLFSALRDRFCGASVALLLFTDVKSHIEIGLERENPPRQEALRQRQGQSKLIEALFIRAKRCSAGLRLGL
jgi:hypothetical protein